MLFVCSTGDSAGTDAPVRQKRGRKRQITYPLDPQHPQYATHEIMERTSEVLPVLVGPNLPLQTEKPADFTSNIMTRYMPFRNVTDLLDMGATWAERFAAFEHHEHTAYVKVCN